MRKPGLPEGWAWSTVDDVGLVQLGRQRSPSNHVGENMRPYLRVANVFEDRIDTSDVMSMNFTPEEYPRYRLEVGDILLNEGQSPELLGRPAMYRGDPPNVCFTNSLIRFRAYAGIEPGWALLVFRHHMHSLRFKRESQITTNIAHLSAGRLKPVEFPVPPTTEQRRIVAAADAAFSKLDAGAAYLTAAKARLERLLDATVASHLLTVEVDRVLLGDLAWDAGYGTSVRCTYEDEGMPVLRIPNIQGGRIDMTDLKRAPAGSAIKEDSLVRSGDLLIVRTNGSRNLIGRAAAATEDLEVTFASYLIRYRLRLDRVLPQFVSAMFRSRSIRRQLERRAASTAGQYNLSLRTLRDIEVPLPSIPEQGRIVAELDEVSASIRSLDPQLVAASRRSEALRRSVLSAAFSGELVPQDPSDEPAELFLKELTSDRPAATRRTRVQRPRVDARGTA